MREGRSKCEELEKSHSSNQEAVRQAETRYQKLKEEYERQKADECTIL